ncbi:MAG TPA: hypothetical protein VHA52_11005 [Candidatus Babeliaceae bacterium]|nr:hypothetical protein [Candidatus Babeliaceae bacterium]
MDYVVFERFGELKKFFIEYANRDDLLLIAELVEDMAGFSFFFQWLSDKDSQPLEMSTNSCYIEKQGYWVEVQDLYGGDTACIAKLPLNELVKIFIQWEKLKNEEVKYICILCEGLTYSVKGYADGDPFITEIMQKHKDDKTIVRFNR